MAGERIDPLFFGAPERRLFGCHHGPPDGAAGKLGLVIAPPLGHEYARAHRALRRLASACAAEGLRALRFDFSSTGDSAGDAWPETLDVWRDDVRLALRELASRTRVPRSALLGVRLAASLVLDCAALHPSASALVLWDPCLDGAEHARALAALEARFEATLPARPGAPRADAAGLECLGQLWPATLLERLRAWTPPSFEQGAPARVLILESSPSPQAGELAARLSERGSRVRRERSSGPEPWNEDVDRGLVPARDLRTIVDFLREDAGA